VAPTNTTPVQCTECDKLNEIEAAARKGKGPDRSRLTDVVVLRRAHKPTCPREAAE
jgi:hypothetical protein